MELTLPDNLETRLSPEFTALHLAIGLYVAGETTLGQSAEVAHISQSAFLRELGNRGICIQYGEKELAEDLQTVESLSRE
jgi:predicted HTH domain antitoxin